MFTSMFPNAPPPGNRTLKRRITEWFTQGYVRMWIVVPLAFVGMGYYALRRADDRSKAAGLLLIVTILYFTGVPALINWPEERFRLPIDALLFMFACVAGEWLVRLIVVDRLAARNHIQRSFERIQSAASMQRRSNAYGP